MMKGRILVQGVFGACPYSGHMKPENGVDLLKEEESDL